MKKSIVFEKRGSRKPKYAMITAYDALTSGMLEAAGVDIILVGDSVGMVLLGYENTAMVSMEEMLHHAKAARRGAPGSFILGDLPRKGVEQGPHQTLLSAQRFVHEAGMDGVKIEWDANSLKATELMVKNKIFVQGHVGLTPQKAKTSADFKVHGKKAEDALEILNQARAFESAGASMLLVECVPWQLARLITESVKIPVIGIGAGAHCDGQVIVFQDLIGMFDRYKPKFVKNYAHTNAAAKKAVSGYLREVRRGTFPSLRESFVMELDEFKKLKESVPGKKSR